MPTETPTGHGAGHQEAVWPTGGGRAMERPIALWQVCNCGESLDTMENVWLHGNLGSLSEELLGYCSN